MEAWKLLHSSILKVIDVIILQVGSAVPKLCLLCPSRSFCGGLEETTSLECEDFRGGPRLFFLQFGDRYGSLITIRQSGKSCLNDNKTNSVPSVFFLAHGTWFQWQDSQVPCCS
jgi:hypothetical protein